MKFVINESQYNKLLSEQKVFTDEKQYEEALKQYNCIINFLKVIQNINFLFTQLYNGEITFSEFDRLTKRWFDSFQCNIKVKTKNIFTELKIIGYVRYEFCFKTENSFYSKRYKELVKDEPKKFRIKCSEGIHVYDEAILFEPPKKPILQKMIPVADQNPTVTPVVNSIVTATTMPIKTNFSATFGQDGKQETIYFDNFDEWKKFDDSVRGKFGYINSTFNQSETEASTLLKGTPSDWGL